MRDKHEQRGLRALAVDDAGAPWTSSGSAMRCHGVDAVHRHSAGGTASYNKQSVSLTSVALATRESGHSDETIGPPSRAPSSRHERKWCYSTGLSHKPATRSG